jgi:putative peptidoglycan lipid II flippase
MGAVMLIMLAGKVTGLLRDIFITALYGTESIEAKAYTAMSTVPRTFLDFAFAAAVSASFIPIFNGYLKNRTKEDSFRLADSFITLIFILSLAVTLLGVVFAPQIVGFAYSGYDVRETELAVSLLRLTLFTIVLSGVAFSLTGVLQSLGGFYAPAAMSIISNLLIISYCFLFIDKLGIRGLAAVFVIGWLTQILILILPLRKRGYVYKPRFNFKTEGMRQIGLLALPVLISSGATPINAQINQSVASALHLNVPVIDKAYTLFSVMTGVFILSITNVVFPKLSKQADDPGEFAATLRGTVSGMLFIVLPMMLGLSLLAEPVASLIYERGAFTSADSSATGRALAFYALGIPGFGLTAVLTRGFYAVRNGITPLLAAVASIAVNFVFSFALSPYLGEGGPALASSVSVSVTAIILFSAMYLRNKALLDGRAVASLIKIIAASGLMFLAVYFLRDINAGLIVRLVISAGGGAAVYFAATYLLRLNEMKIAIKIAIKLIRKNRGKNV